jgi:hypothetical protein
VSRKGHRADKRPPRRRHISHENRQREAWLAGWARKGLLFEVPSTDIRQMNLNFWEKRGGPSRCWQCQSRYRSSNVSFWRIVLKNSLLLTATKRDSLCIALVDGVGDDGRAVWIAGGSFSIGLILRNGFRQITCCARSIWFSISPACDHSSRRITAIPGAPRSIRS